MRKWKNNSCINGRNNCHLGEFHLENDLHSDLKKKKYAGVRVCVKFYNKVVLSYVNGIYFLYALFWSYCEQFIMHAKTKNNTLSSSEIHFQVT